MLWAREPSRNLVGRGMWALEVVGVSSGLRWVEWLRAVVGAARDFRVGKCGVRDGSGLSVPVWLCSGEVALAWLCFGEKELGTAHSALASAALGDLDFGVEKKDLVEARLVGGRAVL